VMKLKSELAIRIGGEGLCQLLKTSEKISFEKMDDGSTKVGGIGFTSTVDFIVRTLSEHADFLLEELLVLAPALHSYAEFLRKMPIYEVTEDELELWISQGAVV